MSNTSPKHTTRGSVQKAGSTFIAAWIPNEIVAALDTAVRRDDSDRSKLLRKALRAYLPRP